MDSKRPPVGVTFALIAACVVALADWPYGYYQILRLALTGYASWIAWSAFEGDRTYLGSLFALIAILYNPIVKIPLERETWEVANLVTAGILVAEYFASRTRRTQNVSERWS